MNKKEYKSLTDSSYVENLINNVPRYKLAVTDEKETSAKISCDSSFNKVHSQNISHKVRTCTNGIIRFSLVLSLLFTLFSCKQNTKALGPKYGKAPVSQTTPIYHFAVHPFENPAKLTLVFQPIVDYLNSRLKGGQLTLEASKDYSTFEKKYKDRKPEFLLPNPWQTLQAIQAGYNVIAMAGEPKDFKGIFIVRRDGDISEMADLKGKTISYPSPTALAACIMPQYFLYTHGIDVNKDVENRYVGSQESSIMNVYLKMTSAGATWPTPWRTFQKEHPKEASQLKVIWETESLINNSVMIRNDLPADIRNQVQKYLIEMHKSKQGKTILSNMETARFILATDKDYDIVQKYIDRFEKQVRKIDTK